MRTFQNPPKRHLSYQIPACIFNKTVRMTSVHDSFDEVTFSYFTEGFQCLKMHCHDLLIFQLSFLYRALPLRPSLEVGASFYCKPAGKGLVQCKKSFLYVKGFQLLSYLTLMKIMLYLNALFQKKKEVIY